MNRCLRRWVALLCALQISITEVASATPPQIALTAGMDGAVGVPSYPVVNNANVFMFYLGPNSAPPACAAGQGTNYRWSVNLTTPGGVAQMKIVMAAYASGAQMVVFGNGTCSIWSPNEDVQYLYINH